jgi:uncharacterized protein YcbK (DUF882 family)
MKIRLIKRAGIGVFLAGSFLSLPAALLPLPADSAGPRILSADRRLALYSLNSRKSIDVEYCQAGYYDPEALSAIDHLLRDPINGDVRGIDPKLLDLLYELHEKVGGKAPFTVLCGYRSPRTNASLREFNKAVAEQSLHMQGKAVDIRLPGVPLAALRTAALELKSGGVGYYPRSGFLHVDVGPVRSW